LVWLGKYVEKDYEKLIVPFTPPGLSMYSQFVSPSSLNVGVSVGYEFVGIDSDGDPVMDLDVQFGDQTHRSEVTEVRYRENPSPEEQNLIDHQLQWMQETLKSKKLANRQVTLVARTEN